MATEPVHQVQVLTGSGCSYFSEYILRFNGAVFSVVDDVPVDSEASVVTSSISRFASSTQFFGDAHRGKVCVRAYVHRDTLSISK